MGGYDDEMIIADGADGALQRAGLGSVGGVLRCLGDQVAAWSRSTDTVRVGPGAASGGPTFYVKRYHYPKLARRWASLLQGLLGGRHRAGREYDQLRDLAGRGLPVVRALATGQRRRRGLLRSCFLITEGFEGGRPLDQVAARWTGSPEDRRALINALAREVAGMHRAGVIHGQLFRRNVLVRRDGDGGYDIRFLDFAATPKKSRCGGNVAGDLGALGSGAVSFCSRTECVRFMGAYCGVDRLGVEGRELMRVAARIGRQFEDTEKRRLRLGRLFDEPEVNPKLLTVRGQAPKQAMSIELHIRADCREILTANGLDSLEAFMSAGLGVSLDKPGLASWRRRSRLVLGGPGGRQHTYYLKCYDCPPASKRWARLLGGAELAAGPAAYEVAQMEALQQADLPALRWAAWGQERDGARELRSFVLSEAVPGEALERWLPGCYEKMSERQRARVRPAIFERLAELVRRLHQAGFVHRDLYASHIFIEITPVEEVRLHLIDLQRVFKPRRLRSRWRVKDLAELDYSVPARFASGSDRLRWLGSYLGADQLSREQLRLARRIAEKTTRIARHDERRRQRRES